MSDDFQRYIELLRRAVAKQVAREIEAEMVYGPLESRVADELIRESGAVPPKPKGIFG